MTSKFKIKGLDCANCASQLEREIKKIDGVENASISFMTERMELEYDGDNKEKILKETKKRIKREEPDVTIEEV